MHPQRCPAGLRIVKLFGFTKPEYFESRHRVTQGSLGHLQHRSERVMMESGFAWRPEKSSGFEIRVQLVSWSICLASVDATRGWNRQIDFQASLFWLWLWIWIWLKMKLSEFVKTRKWFKVRLGQIFLNIRLNNTWDNWSIKVQLALIYCTYSTSTL